MTNSARITLITGIIILILTVVNGYTVGSITPSFERSEVLAGLAGVLLMLVAFIWSDANPRSPEQAELKGENSLLIVDSVSATIKKELGWGSQLILTSTPAATMLVYWKDSVLLRRGLIQRTEFIPGGITKRVIKSGETISLVNTRFFPGRAEFDSVLINLPAILVVPLAKNGVVIVGGWSERCFTKSNEIVIQSWALRLADDLETGISTN